jgi:hypothetical protein
LRPGDEIIVPAYGMVSTINAFASFGWPPPCRQPASTPPRSPRGSLRAPCLGFETFSTGVAGYC